MKGIHDPEIAMATDRRTLREGLVVGLIGYASVAVFYTTFDVFAARGPLHTVDVLGRAVFRGLRDRGVLLFPMQIDVWAISLYNVMHLVIALSIGLIVTRLAAEAERHPSRARLVLLALIAGFVCTVSAVGILTTSMRPILPWWSIVAANVLATVLAGWYLVRRRRGFWLTLTGLTTAAR